MPGASAVVAAPLMTEKAGTANYGSHKGGRERHVRPYPACGKSRVAGQWVARLGL